MNRITTARVPGSFRRYADGDLFDARQPAGYHKLDREGLYQWGPNLPDDFVAARPTLGQVASLCAAR